MHDPPPVIRAQALRLYAGEANASWDRVLAVGRRPGCPPPGAVYWASILEDLETRLRDPATGLLRDRVRAAFPEAAFARVNSACTSGAVALALAVAALRRGRCETALVVGYETAGAFITAGFKTLRTVASGRPQPFAPARDGFRLRGAAGAMLLASGGEGVHLAGAWVTNDAHHPTGPHREGDGLKRAIEGCLASAALSPADVDAVKLSGAGTAYSDEAEYKALSAVFGARLAVLPAFVPKARIGHAQGASGIVETILAAHALEHGRLPGAGRYVERGLAFDLDLAADARRTDARTLLLVFSGFGGQNACLLLRKGVGA